MPPPLLGDAGQEASGDITPVGFHMRKSKAELLREQQKVEFVKYVQDQAKVGPASVSLCFLYLICTSNNIISAGFLAALCHLH